MKEEIKILKPRQPKWKMSKMMMPHCPICKERLTGNDYHINPYKCSCGEWKSDLLNLNYYIIKN